ncbi:MAG TPA: cytochrome P450, partial [Pirellulales bacterium]|nr:cytochrome P450 [Pirellulales bacterium]
MATATSVCTSSASSRKWPEIRGRWLTGCLRQLQFAPLTLYRESWRALGDYIRIRALPGIPIFLLAHPAAIEHVLHDNHKNYRKPDSFNHAVRLLAGAGILTSEGEFWRRQRRLVQPAFTRNSVAALSTHMVESIDRFLQEWERAG